MHAGWKRRARCIVIVVLWVLLAHSSPASHPRISPAERKYIESSLEEEGNAVKVGLAPSPGEHSTGLDTGAERSHEAGCLSGRRRGQVVVPDWWVYPPRPDTG